MHETQPTAELVAVCSRSLVFGSSFHRRVSGLCAGHWISVEIDALVPAEIPFQLLCRRLSAPPCCLSATSASWRLHPLP